MNAKIIIEHEIFDEHVTIGSDTLAQFCTFNKGVTIRGDNNLFRLNTITNSETGIQILGELNTVMMNDILRFCIDGIRILNSYNAVTDNTITGSYLSNPDNHNDGIQIFTQWDAEDDWIHGLNVSRNRLYLSDAEISTQGIIATDCVVTDSIFDSNVIDVNHWHGLTLAKSEECYITKNIITNTHGVSERVPWIKIVSDFGGTYITENTVPSIVGDYLSEDNRLVALQVAN